MTFAQGQITSTDLSPNAGILGTQIADKTLTFRNFNDDTFRIAKTGSTSVTLPAASYTIGQLNQTTISHGLSTTPAFLLYVNNPPITSIGSGLQLAPASTYAQFNALPGGLPIDLPTVIAFGTVDSTNFYINIQFLTAYTFGSAFTWTFKYYILAETAS